MNGRRTHLETTRDLRIEREDVQTVHRKPKSQSLVPSEGKGASGAKFFFTRSKPSRTGC